MLTKNFLKYRNVWLGVAMIWMVWYHTQVFPNMPGLKHLIYLGYGGVDVCLFASGIGCYFSLCKDSDPFRFMKRRFARLLPTYLIFICIWLIYKLATVSMPIPAILGNILGIQNFTTLGNDFNWYISAIFLLYLLAPLGKSLADHTPGIMGQARIVVLLVLFSVPFWSSSVFMITVTRIPIFYVGMVFGKLCTENTSVSRRLWYSCMGAGTLGLVMVLVVYEFCYGYLWDWGLGWYPFILITPGLCMGISGVMLLLEKSRIGHGIAFVLDKVGQYSFEIYLVHAMVFDMVRYIAGSLGWFADSLFVWPAAIVVSALGSVALRWGVQLLKKCTKLPV